MQQWRFSCAVMGCQLCSKLHTDRETESTSSTLSSEVFLFMQHDSIGNHWRLCSMHYNCLSIANEVSDVLHTMQVLPLAVSCAMLQLPAGIGTASESESRLFDCNPLDTDVA